MYIHTQGWIQERKKEGANDKKFNFHLYIYNVQESNAYEPPKKHENVYKNEIINFKKNNKSKCLRHWLLFVPT